MKIFFSLLLLLSVAANQLQAQPVTIKRDSFSLKYPAGWTIDTEDEDYDPDALFSLDSPDDENMIMFMIGIPMEADDLLKAQVEAFTTDFIKKAEVTSFDTWGKYKGKGKLLKGKLLGLFNGFVRIFIYTDDYKTMMVVEQCYDKAYQTLEKDYELIRSSFTFH
ncbi:MAG: hypothetical protein ABW019_14355 [Chitinophagaceae bacterium]